MERRLILFLCLMLGFSAQAQMTDLIGSMAIQGQMSTQGMGAYGIASTLHNKNTLMQELQIQVIEIKTKYLNGYSNVSRETIKSPILKKYNTQIKSDGNSFYFELHNVDSKLCKTLTSGFAGSYKIDNKNCQNIKIYYK